MDYSFDYPHVSGMDWAFSRSIWDSCIRNCLPFCAGSCGNCPGWGGGASWSGICRNRHGADMFRFSCSRIDFTGAGNVVFSGFCVRACHYSVCSWKDASVDFTGFCTYL